MTDVFRDDILAGKAAFVAGGTRGMNLAIAKKLAAKGARVAVMSRDADRVRAAEAELRSIHPDCLGLQGDARDYERVSAAFAEAAGRFGGLDIAVAGQAGNFYAPVSHLSSNGFRAVMDIDLLGTFHVFKAAGEHLKRGGSLIAITAPEAVRPLHFQAHVCAAKAGVNQLVRVLSLEWGPRGIRVNAISPGPIEGSWGMANVASPTPELVAKITQAVPLKRWGTEEDIANTALFLSSDAASYITGVILECDGGVTIASPEGAAIDALGDLTRDARVKRPA